MRILVCGGRDFQDKSHAWRVLDAVHNKHGITCIIHGAAKGADALGAQWASHMGINVDAYPAAWHSHGKSAGPMRNDTMLIEGKPDAVVAFPGGKGTADMVRRSKAAGLPVWEVNSTAS